MKSLKICSLVALMLLALVGCNKNKDGQGGGNNTNTNTSSLVNQWCLTSWDEQAPEFNVYLQFKADGSFDIYQQVWNLTYDHFNGTYTINDDIVSGTYANGDSWACGYRFEIVDGILKFYSQEDVSITSIYETCTIPQEVIDEADATRATDVAPLL